MNKQAIILYIQISNNKFYKFFVQFNNVFNGNNDNITECIHLLFVYSSNLSHYYIENSIHNFYNLIIYYYKTNKERNNKLISGTYFEIIESIKIDGIFFFMYTTTK